MDVRLIVRGEVEPGTTWEFWKEPADSSAVPRIGDQVSLGTSGGAAHHLTVREVASVEWSADLSRAEVYLADLHAGWLQANRAAFREAGWITAVAGG